MQDGNSNDVPADGTAQLALLAMRILSMVPNSASVEHIFSLFGIVQMRHRNRLHQEKVCKIVQVRQDTGRQFGTGTCGSRMRTFGDDCNDDFDMDDGRAPGMAQQSSSAPDQHEGGSLSTADAADDVDQGPVGGTGAGGQGDAEFIAMAREMMDEAEEEGSDATAPTQPPSTLDPDARLLKNLFDYPRENSNTSKSYRVLTHYWAMGLRNLELELQHQEEEYRSTQTTAAPSR